MGIIRINNIVIYANHGCLEEEAKIGSEYRVDIKIEAGLEKSAGTDRLENTVDYVHLNRIAKEEMTIRSKLLEHVAKRILDRIFEEIQLVREVEVSVSKINPPIGGNVGEVTVVLSDERKS